MAERKRTEAELKSDFETLDPSSGSGFTGALGRSDTGENYESDTMAASEALRNVHDKYPDKHWGDRMADIYHNLRKNGSEAKGYIKGKAEEGIKSLADPLKKAMEKRKQSQ